MHPEIARSLARERWADLICQRRPAGPRPRPRWRAWQWGRGRRVGPGPAAADAWAPGVFLAEPEAFGFRAYLTPEEAGRLAADWSRVVRRYAGRLAGPGRRPAGARLVEVVVLAQRLPEDVAAPGPWPGHGG